MINPYNISNPYNLDSEQIMSKLPYEKKNQTQHLEGGIIQILVDNILDNKKTFLEIGFGIGGENMTTFLINQGWNGIGVDAVDQSSVVVPNSKNFKYKSIRINPENLKELLEEMPTEFDFFSLDIDSYDFEISKKLLELGYKPKVVCLEFNPRFGNKVEASFPFKKIIKKKLYRKRGIYGCSIKKYISLWEAYGYKFFTYDSSLTNLFFYDPNKLKDLSSIKTHTLDQFPIKEDQNKKLIEEHGMWDLREIYREYK